MGVAVEGWAYNVPAVEMPYPVIQKRKAHNIVMSKRSHLLLLAKCGLKVQWRCGMHSVARLAGNPC